MSITTEDRHNVAKWALETLRALGHESMEDNFSIEWSNRFTSRMGDARYIRMSALRTQAGSAARAPRSSEKPEARVRFSIPLWHLATEKERYETVVHEVCHIVTFREAHLAGRQVSSAHGFEWQATMLRAGVAPERCHKIDTSSVKNKGAIRGVFASCECKMGCRVTDYIGGRIASGEEYRCNKCKKRLTVPKGTPKVAKRRTKRRPNRRPIRQGDDFPQRRI